jgi:predicted aspartyl protease
MKFPDDPIHVARKGKSIKAIPYAFLAQVEMRCWKYVTVERESYPIIPATITGTKKIVAASSPDTAASLTIVSSQIADEAGLRPAAEETVATAGGMVRMNTFKALIELPVGRYDAVVASSEIPRNLPFQILLGRNILDLIDIYALGKNKVICVKDP